jgi:hypothetical protein
MVMLPATAEPLSSARPVTRQFIGTNTRAMYSSVTTGVVSVPVVVVGGAISPV